MLAHDPWRRVSVRVTRNALYDLLFAAVEAFVVPPELLDDSLARLTEWDRSRKGRRIAHSPLPPSLVVSRSGLETSGILVGRSVESADHVAYVVEHMFPVTAQRADHSVSHSERSPELLSDLAWALGAEFQIVGGFHSHPIEGTATAEIEANRLYGPSVGDLNGGPIFCGNHVGLIVTVARGSELRPTPAIRPCPWTQFRVGGFEIWICAYAKGRSVLDLDVDLPHVVRDPAENPDRVETVFGLSD